MVSLTSRIPDTSKKIAPLILLLSVVLLSISLVTLYWIESLFTESHLVGYYCCVTEQDLPAHGTLERTLSDFFQTSPGKHLPSLIFVLANVAIFIKGMKRVRESLWFPFLFVAFTLLYLVVNSWLYGVSWSISDSINGPQTTAYKGYDRTWYGIVLHLVLWGVYFAAVPRAISFLSDLRDKRPALG